MKKNFYCQIVSSISVAIFSLHFSGDLAARSLAESAALALDSSPQLSGKKVELDLQKQRGLVVESSLYPSVSIGLGIGREDSNNASTRLDSGSQTEELERREASVSLRQMIFDGYDTHWSRYAEDAKYSALLLELEMLAQDVAADALRAHIEVVTAQAIRGLNSDNWKAHKRISEDIEKRVSLGRDDGADVSQVMARLALSSANLEEAGSKLDTAKAVYEQRVGVSFASSSSDLELSLIDELTRSEFETAVFENNLSLKIAKAGIDISKYRAQASKSSSWPSVYIDAGASWNANLDGIRGNNGDAFAMLRLDYDLFTGGGRSANQKRNFLEIDRGRTQIDELQQWLNKEITSVWSKKNRTNRRISFLGEYVLAAQKTKEAYEKQFEVGRRNLVDLLDAENELALARREFSMARSELMKNQVRVFVLQAKLLPTLALEAEWRRD